MLNKNWDFETIVQKDAFQLDNFGKAEIGWLTNTLGTEKIFVYTSYNVR